MELFVPGRLCLFGEHTDWAGTYRRFNGKLKKGFALVVGTNQGMYARVNIHGSRLIYRTRDKSGEEKVLDLPMETEVLLKEAQRGEFFSYIAGVAYQIMTHYRVRGLEIDNYKTDLPMSKGLSSSAAVCVLVARAFNRLYDLKLTTRGEMEYAYRGEITTPSRCGRLDQACAYGNRPVMLTFDGDQLDVEEISVKTPLYYIIVDLKASKDTIKILADLNQSFPFATDVVQKGVQNYLGEISSEITEKARQSIQEGLIPELGQLMNAAQEGFDRYCRPASPAELASPILHGLMANKLIGETSLGIKGVGSQGDGSAQILVANKKDQFNVIRILESIGMEGIPLDILPPKRILKGVIPAAGFGTRLFPATKSIKKEFFPIITADGRCKPLILLIVEEAIESGLEELAIIVRSGDRSYFEDFFHNQLSGEFYSKLSNRDAEYLEKLMEYGRRITFIEQDIADGFGHAVYCAREWVGNEPFVLLLGDHLYKSRSDRRCVLQVIDAFGEIGRSVVGLKASSVNDAPHFGCVTGRWVSDELLSISDIVEKPDPEYADEFLATERLNAGEVLTFFGIYALSPIVFSHLATAIEHNQRVNGEIQLTPSLDRIRREDGFFGLLVEGDRYDIGQPGLYLQSLIDYANK